MKHLIIVFFLILISCKSEPKNDIKPEVKTEHNTKDSSPEIDTRTEEALYDIWNNDTEEIVYTKTTDKTVYEMWNNFTTSYPEFKKEDLPHAEPFYDNKEDANRLANLIISGKKQATSGLYVWYEELNIGLPKIGTKLIVTDFDGKAKAIIRTTKVDTIAFNKISKTYAALDMGTEIAPLEKWKKAHWAFFASTVDNPTDNLLVVCETFETIWPETH